MSGTDKSLEAVIDYEVSLFDKSEIAGAYRSICAMLLLRTATVVRKHTRFRNMETQQKASAKRWVQAGDEGVITFREACAAIDVEPDQMRSDILRGCKSNQESINKVRPTYIFGRADDETCRKVQAVS